MEEFKSHIGIQLRSGDFDERKLQLLSTVGVSFCHDVEDDLLTPCWLCIINLMALDRIGDPDGECYVRKPDFGVSNQARLKPVC